MTVPRLSAALCLSAALLVAGAAHADEPRRGGRGADQGRAGVEEPVRSQRDGVSLARQARHDALADSVRRVQSRTGGQVLSAERVPFDGRDISRVKVVDERGRVRVYMDDPGARPRRPPRPTRGDDD